jgi:predicted peptidase
VSLKAKKLDKIIQKQINLDYLLYLPKGYEESDAKYPLVIFLHGAGERGSDVEKLKVHGIPKLIAGGKNFNFIAVAPQCPEDKWWGDAVEDEFENLLKDCIEDYRVDTSRIYLTGLSMGGFGSWYYAWKYNKAFAAVIPICGGVRSSKIKDVEAYKNIPMWVFHGAKDNVVPLSSSTAVVNALNDIDADVKFTVYPEAEHDSWTETYENPALYKWMLSKTNENFEL